MPSSFGQWLVVILALLVGLGVGRVVSGRRTAAGPAAHTAEDGPATPAAGTTAPQPSVADVDELPPPSIVTDTPASAERDAPTAVEATAEPETAVEPETTVEPETAEATPPAEDGPTRTADAEPVTDGEPAAVAVRAEPAEPAEATAVIPAPRAAVEDVIVTEVDAAAATPAGEGIGDDFRRIQGIGPKMAAALQAAGIRTYRQLAELDEAALRETIRAAGLRAAPSLSAWPQQAKALAEAGAEAAG